MTILRFLLAVSFAAAAAAQPSFFDVRFSGGPLYQRSATITVEVETKKALADPEELTLHLGVFGGLVIESWEARSGAACESSSEQVLTCAMAASAPGAKQRITLRVAYGSSTLRVGRILAEMRWRERGLRPERRRWQFDLHDFTNELVVTNTDDAGPGSFRQALADANTTCLDFNKPCRIRFDLGEGAVIQPRTAYPAITAATLHIDGASRVVLDGSLMTEPANGLVTGGYGNVTVNELTIQRFPENGIESRAVYTRLRSCVVARNGSRGVMAAGGQTLEIDDSVFSGNGRSGIFLDAGSNRLFRNRIDGNGASGIFVGAAHDATMIDNDITGNAHWGVASVASHRHADVGPNRIAGNRAGQIDVGLDGPSLFPQPDPVHSFQPPNGPVLLSATYDPETGRTTVTGRLDAVQLRFYWISFDLHFYATTSANDADEFLGTINVRSEPEFTVTFPYDLRGRFITANSILWFNDEWIDRGTSELSTPIEVREKQ